jgi:hypothetical protein
MTEGLRGHGPYQFGMGALLIVPVFLALIFAALRKVQTSPKAVARAMSEHEAGGCLVRITYFTHLYRDIAASVTCVVDDDGGQRRLGYCHPSPEAARKHESGRLSGEQLPGLRGLLDTLPPASGSPHWTKVLMVSYHEIGTWTTRTYDQTALPPSAKALCNLVEFYIPQ